MKYFSAHTSRIPITMFTNFPVRYFQRLRTQLSSKSVHYVLLHCRANQWRRTVVKYGGQGQSGQAIKLLHQITPYVNDFQTLNNPGS